MELTKHFEGKKWEIVYGSYDGMEKRSVDMLYAVLKRYVPYIPEVVTAPTDRAPRRIYVGTKQSSGFIAEYTKDISFAENELYYKVGTEEIIISGADESAVFYSVCAFADDFLPYGANAPAKHINDLSPFIDDFFPAEYRHVPSAKERGLWTWGHVIFDYKKYIENLARLKMNRVTIWNDVAPVNAREVVEYAHSWGVKVIWGFSWGWGEDVNIASDDCMRAWGEKALDVWNSQYAATGADGIYFQMFTETSDSERDGVCIASAAVKWVNHISGRILSAHPGLHIEFGLHATSVRSKLDIIAGTDPRVDIVWEDCGDFPWGYRASLADDQKGTLDFTDAITSLRGGNGCGAVMKGACWLNWSIFANQKAPFVLGVSEEDEIIEKLPLRTESMRFQESFWMRNGEYALEVIRLFCKNTHGNAIISDLAEDGLFERRVHLPIALFAEMCFDCESDFKTLLSRVSGRSYVNRA